MDDNRFDDIMKGRVGEYQEPGFDPTALADLHYRMAAVDGVWPWYALYRTELFVGTGLILCTLIILWNQWFLSSQGNMLQNDNQNALLNQGEQISKLQNEINYLRNLQPDTVRIIEFREKNSAQYITVLNRVASLEAALKSYQYQPMKDGAVADADAVKSDRGFISFADPYAMTDPHRIAPRQVDRKSVRVPWDGKNTDVEANERSLSMKAMRGIENHYQQGIGIRVGPTLEISKGIYSLGKGKIDFAGGLLTDFILSPSLSLETGGKYVHRTYTISDQNDIAEKQFPHVDETLGTPKNVDIDSWILEIPINLKYHYPISLKSHWLAGVGFSPMLFTRQVIEYDYELNGNSSASIYSVYTKGKPELFTGTLNVSLGLNNETKNKNIVETSIYYQHGLGTIGVENISRSFLGLRTVYWFKVR